MAVADKIHPPGGGKGLRRQNFGLATFHLFEVSRRHRRFVLEHQQLRPFQFRHSNGLSFGA